VRVTAHEHREGRLDLLAKLLLDRFPGSMTETAAHVPAHLDASWHRTLLDELCAIERPSASPGEREAAEWLVGELRELGIEGRIEAEPAHGTYWWPLGIAAAAGAVAGLAALRGHRWLGAGLAAIASAAAVDDLPPDGRRRLRQLLPQGERSQVVAELGPADAERTVVLHAHHDAPRTGLL
jgi:acetylornithine deacetylase/succinyl-diaminopimelate desuccinylase-like protein